MHQHALTIRSLTSPKRPHGSGGQAGPGKRDIVVTGPSDGDPVCHDFFASGTISPDNTAVTAQALDQNGNVLATGDCDTAGDIWTCSFSLPSSVPAGTQITVKVHSASPAQQASVDAEVDNC